MRDWTEEEWSEYIREVNAAYWAEEKEYELENHMNRHKYAGDD